MPPIASFDAGEDAGEDYAATLDHESAHATMAAHRVGRDMGKKFEELVAEIGASLLGRILVYPRITSTATLPISITG